MTRVVLDTCALLAFAEGEPMRPEAVRAIRAAQAGAMALVPSTTATEIAQRVAAGKLRLSGGATPRAWFARIMGEPGLREVVVSMDAALAAYELPEPFHRDPADRLIVAIARLLHAPVVTVDRRILDYGRRGHVATLAY